MSVSEVVCETWGPIIDVIRKHRLRLKDRTDEVGANHNRIFIQLNGHLSGYKGTQKFLITSLLFMYDSVYSSSFRNPIRK